MKILLATATTTAFLPLGAFNPHLLGVTALENRSTTSSRRRILQTLVVGSTAGVGPWTTPLEPQASHAAEVAKDGTPYELQQRRLLFAPNNPQQQQQQLQLQQQNPFQYSSEWTGTLLPRVNLEQAVVVGQQNDDIDIDNDVWPMARWPDPVLRIPADPVAEKWFGRPELQRACDLLARTAQQNGAVGLAAQQCGVNARIVFLEVGNNNNNNKNPVTRRRGQRNQKDNAKTENIVMINPQIISRSPEINVRVWDERCLVLPPNFVATVLRDAVVEVQYRTVNGERHVARLQDEPGRAIQHELDHDRGILVTDHVALEDLDSIMQRFEQPGHEDRMLLAFDRQIYDPWLA